MERKFSPVSTDFLVLGGGVAGLRAALELAEDGQVLILNKGKGLEGSSQYAQGGVAVALGGRKDQKTHFRDTLKAGAGMCNEEAAWILVTEGPKRIHELIAHGARFDQSDGRFLFAKEAAHSRPRVLRSKGDTTGEEIVKTLLRQTKRHPRIKLLDDYFILDLIPRDGFCLGALVLNEHTRQWGAILAKATVLSTGGAGQVYLRTTNPATATGDGAAIAYRAGAVLEDMEFVQFHPTALCFADAPAFLLTEALRGEGAILRNKKGEAFMEHYHSDKELAPRDIVSRAIWAEFQAAGGCHVELDLSHIDAAYLKKRFPMIHKTCLSYHIDITREPIPVSPAAHFMIGGVKTDLQGATTLKGLFAVGEVASTQIHGANRLGSNSLLEGLVFGARAAKAARSLAAKDHRKRARPAPPLTLEAEDFRGLDDSELLTMKHEIRKAMWEGAGVVRSQDSLQSALMVLLKNQERVSGCHLSRPVMETYNLFTVAILIARAALQRKGSIGVHFRSDYSKSRGKNWRRHRTFSQRSLSSFLDYREALVRYRSGLSV